MINNISDRNWLIPILSLFFAVCGLLFAFMGLDEFYIVAIKKETGAYPFGMSYQWYYESESIYWKYMLVEGSLYLFASVFTIVSVIRKNKRMSAAGAIAVFILFVIMMINAKSAPYE